MDVVREIGALLTRAVDAGLAPGFTGLVVRGEGAGRVWCAGRTGHTNEMVEPDLHYDLASVTKPLATTTLLLLARRDGLDLETPLGDLLPELTATPWRRATLAQCAAHTAGFPAWAPLYALGQPTRAGYLESLATLQPVDGLGERVEYSCLGFIVLGLALERLGGVELGALFAELVAEPLGVAAEIAFAPVPTTWTAAGEREWFVERALLERRGLAARPLPALAGAVPCDDGNARALGGVAGNAGLFGTAAAVARLAAEYLPGGGDLLTAEEAALATRCWARGPAQVRGLGWQLAATPGCSAGPAMSEEAFGHSGFTGTSLWVEPGQRSVFVLLGNRLCPGGRTADLHPLRRRFNALANSCLSRGGATARMASL